MAKFVSLLKETPTLTLLPSWAWKWDKLPPIPSMGFLGTVIPTLTGANKFTAYGTVDTSKLDPNPRYTICLSVGLDYQKHKAPVTLMLRWELFAQKQSKVFQKLVVIEPKSWNYTFTTVETEEFKAQDAGNVDVYLMPGDDSQLEGLYFKTEFNVVSYDAI